MQPEIQWPHVIQKRQKKKTFWKTKNMHSEKWAEIGCSQQVLKSRIHYKFYLSHRDTQHNDDDRIWGFKGNFIVQDQSFLMKIVEDVNDRVMRIKLHVERYFGHSHLGSLVGGLMFHVLQKVKGDFFVLGRYFSP